ncbi:Ankyrin-2 [Holothuria leucospilota]|uniref:Ankyrin-2 n=1 Tax=Holothuria leucospilota TaxID=206669 RepID=A0A9Q1HKR9_HOLLE|nr:Ankyrin-2 [Holothuria leucospilota]
MAASNSFDNTKVVSQEFMQYLSGEISKEWKELGRYLNLTDAQLNHIEADNPSHSKERIYQMLLLWKQSNGYKATYKVLNDALSKADRSDLVKR